MAAPAPGQPKRRIETKESRTAEYTCIVRAASSFERNPCYRTDDHLAPFIVPSIVRLLIRIPAARRLYARLSARGAYEYVIARTKYIDAVFKKALKEGVEQVLIFGAGFDTRALRFAGPLRKTNVFELDASATQSAKIRQYRTRGLSIPPNLVFVPIDFDKQSLPGTLDAAGFKARKRCLFVLEGLTMYLEPASVDETFRTMRDVSGEGSIVVFDVVLASVLRGKRDFYGGEIAAVVAKAAEPWHFGLDEVDIREFLLKYGFCLTDQQNAAGLERMYFQDANGQTIGRVNAAHCLVTAVKV